MAEFVKPEEMDDMGEPDSSDVTLAGGVSSGTEPTMVDFAGEGEIPITDAVESLSRITQHPEAFEVASYEQIVELQNENRRLRQELETLRGDLAALWEAVSDETGDGRKFVVADSGGYLPESVDVYDPTGEFDE